MEQVTFDGWVFTMDPPVSRSRLFKVLDDMVTAFGLTATADFARDQLAHAARGSISTDDAALSDYFIKWGGWLDSWWQIHRDEYGSELQARAEAIASLAAE